MKIQPATKPSRSKARRLALIGFAMFTLLAMGGAHAQWQVIDRTLIQKSQQQWSKENEQRDKTNDRLKQLYEQQYLDEARSSGDSARAPNQKPQQVAEDKDIERCKKVASTQVALQQFQLCQEIIRTENAQYNYAVAMYENTDARRSRLREIERHRQGLSEAEQGKLQDNTNQLLALHALMEIDRQQAQTAMDAFETRLRALRQQQTRVTDQALKGKTDSGALGGIGQIGGVLMAGGAMATALEAVKTSKPPGMRRFGD